MVQSPLTIKNLFLKIKLKSIKWKLKVTKRSKIRSQPEFTIMSALGMTIILLSMPSSKRKRVNLCMLNGIKHSDDKGSSNNSNNFIIFYCFN